MTSTNHSLVRRCVAGAAFSAALLLTPATPFASDDVSDALRRTVVPSVLEWVRHPVILIALKAQNARHTGISEEKILELDAEWQKQREQQDQPLIAQLFGSPASTYLTRLQAGGQGLYAEIFVMDNVGLNVGLSSVTSDYWQGDEAKWQKTYNVGPDAVFIDEPEFNSETGTYRVQVNLTIPDPETGKALGVITVEVNTTELARRQMLGLLG